MKKKPLTEAQRKQRAIYSSELGHKRNEKRVTEIDALKRATGQRAV